MVSTPAQQLAEEDTSQHMKVQVELPTAYADFNNIFDK
jgi:hypothetical protein